MTVKEIQTYHMQKKGFSDIAYHFLIGLDGTIYEGRQLEGLGLPEGPFTKGSHVEENNTNAGIGLCIIGDYERNFRFLIFGQGQSFHRQSTVENVCTALCRRYGLSASQLSYHKQMALPQFPTECPGKRVIQVFPDIQKNVGDNLR